jgi:hypothetical protein
MDIRCSEDAPRLPRQAARRERVVTAWVMWLCASTAMAASPRWLKNVQARSRGPIDAF